MLSSLLEMKLVSADGLVLGKIWDLAVDINRPEPEVTKLIYRLPWSRRRRKWLPWSSVESLAPDHLTLKPGADEGKVVDDGVSGVLLRDFLLDKQIVDIDGAKVERVNDLQFLRSNGKMVLVQVDVGVRGLLRRLGWENAVAGFCEWFFDYRLKDRYISWRYVQPLHDPDRLRLQITQSKLASLHPADLADIIEDMDLHERAAVAESFQEDILADAFEEMDPKVQVSIVRGLDPEKAADIIEEMSPDEAADLLADLPDDTVETIFSEMDDSYEEKVRGLLLHEEDEAGGLMSTQFLALPPNSTIVDALAHIRRMAHNTDVIYYIYVVDQDRKLLGVINLRQLLSTEIFTPLEQIMTTRLITADIDDSARHLASLFGKYGFRAIPVTDEEGRIQGVVRFKALLEILAPYIGQ